MVMIPVSLGELIDKITILEIKLLEIKNESQIKNIKTEYDLLINLDKYVNVVNEADLIAYKKTLYDINYKLWKIEDSIREKERMKKFDDQFVHLARSVYITNDARSKVKKEINVKYESSIVEEKSYKEYV